MIGGIVLAIRFACELGALGVLGYFGEHTAGIPLAIALPLVTATVWGAWIAPRARRRLRDPLRFAVESIVWAAATASLVALDQRIGAAGFAVAAFGSAIAARRFEPQVSNGDGSSPRLDA